MNDELIVIKYYSDNDLSIGYNIELAEPVINAFDPSCEYSDVNKIIELYNIQMLVNTGIVLEKWDDKTIDLIKEKCKHFTAVIAKFFSNIDNISFICTYHALKTLYIADFWTLFSKFKTFRRIDSNIFSELISSDSVDLLPILKCKDIVCYYDPELASFMRVSTQSAELLIESYLVDEKSDYYFPKSLLPSEYESIFVKYIESEHPNANYLNLIGNSLNTKECPISDALRLKAIRRYNEIIDQLLKNRPSFEFGVDVLFDPDESYISCKTISDGISQLTYSLSWIEDNLDYPTLLNNFRYLFEQFDNCWRSTLPFVKSQLGPIEKHLGLRGKQQYRTSSAFRFYDLKSFCEINGYYNILQKNGINMEEVFRWFFEDYLKNEFNADGFFFQKSSSGASYIEKNRNIACEMDGLLKQFKLFREYGFIDRELFEVSSGNTKLDCVGSFIKNKYAYANSTDVRSEMFLLFSDQSPIFIPSKSKKECRSFIELICSECMSLNDFFPYQIQSIKWLTEVGSVYLDEQKQVQPSFLRVFILKDLYEHDVICPVYYQADSKVIEQMVLNNDLRYGSTLFSEPEQEYLNYQLNKSQFSNGLDLRNKYAHSSYPKEESVQQEDYIRLLRAMILLVVKINEEFCLKYP